MRVDKSKIGWTFSSKRASLDAQAAHLRADGAQDVKEIGGPGCPTWRDAVRSVRPGDEVRVYALVLVPTERGSDDLPPSGQPAEFILEVHQRGGCVIEVKTGRNSRDAKDRRAMIADAVRSLRSGGRKLPASGLPAGRPAKKYSAKALEHNERVWKSRDYATNETAERHMLEGMTATQAWRMWGKSGRPWPTRRKRK